MRLFDNDYTVFGSEITVLVFVIVLVESIAALGILLTCLQKPRDLNRPRYLLLILLLISHNILNGLFPDDQFIIPRNYQYMLGNSTGFIMTMYFAWYIFKCYNLTRLKWYATWGTLFFILLPFLLFFAVFALILDKVLLANRLMVIIPSIYGVVYLVTAYVQVYIEHIKPRPPHDVDWLDFISLLFGISCWIGLGVSVFLGDNQVLQNAVTNIGFIMMTVSFFRGTIMASKEDFVSIQEKNKLIHELRDKLNATNSELTKASMVITRNNEIYDELAKKIIELPLESRQLISPTFNKIKQGNEDVFWDTIFQLVDSQSKGYVKRLRKLHPNLTAKDIRHLILLRFDFTQDQISFQLSIKPTSLKSIRSRIKSKMNLTSKIDLRSYLQSV